MIAHKCACVIAHMGERACVEHTCVHVHVYECVCECARECACV